MVQYIIQVSAHAREPANSPTMPVPENYTYNFFCKVGEILNWDQSVRIYEYLAHERYEEVDREVKYKIFGGGTVVNYDLWSLGDPRYVSGTLRAGTTTALVDITQIDQTKPIGLAKLMAMTIRELREYNVNDQLIIYFNACRA